MCILCVPIWLSFECADQFVKFVKKVKISKLLSFFKFCDNRYLSLRAAENLYKSFLMETSKPSAGVGFTAPKTSFISCKCFLLSLDSAED